MTEREKRWTLQREIRVHKTEQSKHLALTVWLIDSITHAAPSFHSNKIESTKEKKKQAPSTRQRHYKKIVNIILFLFAFSNKRKWCTTFVLLKFSYDIRLTMFFFFFFCKLLISVVRAAETNAIPNRVYTFEWMRSNKTKKKKNENNY